MYKAPQRTFSWCSPATSVLPWGSNGGYPWTLRRCLRVLRAASRQGGLRSASDRDRPFVGFISPQKKQSPGRVRTTAVLAVPSRGGQTCTIATSLARSDGRSLRLRAPAPFQRPTSSSTLSGPRVVSFDGHWLRTNRQPDRETGITRCDRTPSGIDASGSIALCTRKKQTGSLSRRGPTTVWCTLVPSGELLRGP